MNKTPLLIVCSGLFIAGCATSNKPNVRYVDPQAQGSVAGTGIESQDLIQVTDKMARAISATPKIAYADRAPTIVLLPVENTTRFPIDKDIFIKRIKAQLATKLDGKVVFVARDRIEAVQTERELKADGKVTSSGSNRKMTGADYFLTGELSGLSQANSRGNSDYVLYTFRLIDAVTSNQVWEDFVEIKKEGQDSGVYR
ncbi:MAG: penicillin-binding protein activator LpoB [Verrucomicrobiota bacterium]|nr:penicillin-binding protein activator LpoB [Verrucomicrobiota bacterium]